MSSNQKKCPDCGTQMEDIRLIDATDARPDGGGFFSTRPGGTRHVELAYAAPEARASFFLKRIPSLGVVRGEICPECGRILLRGEPHPAK